MKAISKIYGAAALAILSFTSCETPATVDVPREDPQLVLNCFISPQDTEFRAVVRLSSPIFSSQNTTVDPAAPVTNATVTLSGASGSVQLVYDANREAYYAPASSLLIVAGQTYSLHVTTPDGKDASAATTVPSPMPASTMNYSHVTLDSNSSGYWRDYSLDLTWNDISGEKNYYYSLVTRRYRQGFSGDTAFLALYKEQNSDAAGDGRQLTTSLDWSNYTQTVFSSGTDSTLDFHCYHWNVNEAYYRYHLSLENFTGDNPFAEPSLIYTNVTGGLGIFAAFNGNEYILQP